MIIFVSHSFTELFFFNAARPKGWKSLPACFNYMKTHKVPWKAKNTTALTKEFAYNKRLWTFFLTENHVTEEMLKFFLPIFIIFNDIEESTISFSDFHLCLHHNQLQLSPSQLFQCAGHEPQLQEPQHFVLLLHINQPISSMSGSQQAWTWPGLPTARPCPTPLSLRGWPPSCTTYPWGSAAPAGCAEMSIVSFQIK